VLDDIDLEVRPGEIVSILGSSGGGKSTVRHSTAATRPSRGSRHQWRTYKRQMPGRPPIRPLRSGLRSARSELHLVSNDTVSNERMAGNVLS
jgi:ABC-type glutathione transport system ATPase component